MKKLINGFVILASFVGLMPSTSSAESFENLVGFECPAYGESLNFRLVSAGANPMASIAFVKRRNHNKTFKHDDSPTVTIKLKPIMVSTSSCLGGVMNKIPTSFYGAYRKSTIFICKHPNGNIWVGGKISRRLRDAYPRWKGKTANECK